MAEHGVSHLVVLEAADGHPVGIISTLDIASAYAA
jgi:CBS domain-containing protein